MKKGSWLVNNARGAICDPPAVVDALQSGHLRGVLQTCSAAASTSLSNPCWPLQTSIGSPAIPSMCTLEAVFMAAASQMLPSRATIAALVSSLPL